MSATLAAGLGQNAIAPEAALVAAHAVMVAHAPNWVQVPPLAKFRLTDNRLGDVIPWLRFAGSFSQITGVIRISRRLYPRVDRGNYQMFLGTLLHEVLHSNQPWLQNVVDAWWRGNPRHAALDRYANRFAFEVLAPAFCQASTARCP